MVISQVRGSKKSTDDGQHIHFRKEKDIELASALDEIRMKEREALVQQEAKQRDKLYINLRGFPMSQDALLILDRQFCEQHRVVCFFYQSEQLHLGTTHPDDPELMQKAKELEEIHRAQVEVYLISEESLKLAFKKYDAIPKALGAHDEGLALTEETLRRQQEKITTVKELNETLARAQTTEVLALIVGAALKSLSSDIHIETEADDIKLRMRIDGVLHDIGILPTDAWPKVVSRVKLLAGLKLNITNKPQDGRFTIYLSGDKTEVRVSTVPTSYGESIVMRLLRFSMEALAFDKLGLTGYTATALRKEIEKPNGMIISTGPTGSGKTTTLYGILHVLNNPGSNILTLEDPIEYKLKGINQTQVNPAVGLDFAKGLRSLLRQDPDIIMVGEIRDLETADTAINAALTGHLVLSTLHTNSAAGALPRFLAMGSKNFLLAPAINCLIGQRLVRRLCEHCKKPMTLDAALRARVNETLSTLKGRSDLELPFDLAKPESYQFYMATGCNECNDFGYRGRIGIFEIMTMNKDLEKIILAGNVSEYEVQETAQKHGMVTMLQDGLLKAMQGITSVEEVFRQAE
ncbi:MAG: type II/IV secretion system protein [Candidatus Komeilibacteria bacterium]|nr:type II/IV secretion system protein [Candidatus Komeilibacteria bacterium]